MCPVSIWRIIISQTSWSGMLIIVPPHPLFALNYHHLVSKFFAFSSFPDEEIQIAFLVFLFLHALHYLGQTCTILVTYASRRDLSFNVTTNLLKFTLAFSQKLEMGC